MTGQSLETVDCEHRSDDQIHSFLFEGLGTWRQLEVRAYPKGTTGEEMSAAAVFPSYFGQSFHRMVLDYLLSLEETADSVDAQAI